MNAATSSLSSRHQHDDNETQEQEAEREEADLDAYNSGVKLPTEDEDDEAAAATTRRQQQTMGTNRRTNHVQFHVPPKINVQEWKQLLAEQDG